MEKKKTRYRAQITVGHMPDGKPIYKWASGKTKKAMEAHKQEIRRTYITGQQDVQRDVLFGQYVNAWYKTYKEQAASKRTGKKLSESSKGSMALVINSHILPQFGARQIRAITGMQLQDHLNGMGKYGKTMIGYDYSILKNVFALAYAQGIIDRDPTAGLQKPQAKKHEQRRALTDAETAAVLKLIESHQDRLLLALLYYTGARRGEALGLQWGDVDLKDRWISIRRDIDPKTDQVGDVKSDYSIRDVPIPDELYEMLHGHEDAPGQYLIQSPRTKTYWCYATFERHWAAIRADLYKAAPSIEAAPIKKGSKILGSILTPHYFRHNYASILYNNGVDVMAAQKFLGHSDPRTTLQIYTHLAKERAEKDAKKVRKAFSSAKKRQENGKNKPDKS